MTTQVWTRARRPATCGMLSIAVPFLGSFVGYLLICVLPLPLGFFLGLLLIPSSLICGVVFAAMAWIRRERYWLLPSIGLLLSLALVLWVASVRSTWWYASPFEVFYRHSDPVAGWKSDFRNQPNKAVVDDYQEYIQKLPLNQKPYASVSGWLEDGTGQHAVVIAIALNGTWWHHVLIYDKNHKRIKAVKYIWGHYAC